MNALGDYSLGYRKHINVTIDDMRENTVIGLVKCEVIPNISLNIPLLPESGNGKLLCHSKKTTGAWTTIELQQALEMGFKMTRACTCVAQTPFKEIMNQYVKYLLEWMYARTSLTPPTERCNP